MKKILIKNGKIVNEGRIFSGDILIENDTISEISENIVCEDAEIISAEDKWILPGVIDDQVHFREPGLTHKEDIASCSMAAAAGGITSFMDMPNVIPPTTTVERWREKNAIAAADSVINYAFYMGASRDNIEEIKKIDPRTTCGLKIFMGSSTGNLIVNDRQVLERIFAESPVLIATHCEDDGIISSNLDAYKMRYGTKIPPFCHPLIRSSEACYKSSSMAVAIARKYGSRLHILHLSTEKEIDLIDKGDRNKRKITGEVCVHHLWFNESAYREKGNLIKWNPAIKTERDRKALIDAINSGAVDVIATDHAPHTKAEKSNDYISCPSGGPLVQHSLPLMLELTKRKETTLPCVVDKMCHAPADIFGIEKRGYIRKGYKADICIIEEYPWKVGPENILYKCHWSPVEGDVLSYKIAATVVNGKIVYDKNGLTGEKAGEALIFER